MPVDTTLTAIQKKVRRLTRRPSTAQLSNDDLNQYINTFVVYDFPEHLRMFNLHTTFTFVCNPYQDVYNTDLTYSVGPLMNFQNKYLTINPPVYIAGYQAFYTQSQEQLFNLYPKINFLNGIGVGNGTNLVFNSILTQFPILMNNVLIDSVDVNNAGLALMDVPVVDANGFPTQNGNLYNPNNLPTEPPIAVTPGNTVNYVTGVITATFPTAPASGVSVNAQTVPYQASRPLAMMYFDNQITLRPIPDQPYTIEFQAFINPTEILAGQSPILNEWWQYIAYGAAKKIFEDAGETESVQAILPEYRKQENLCNRRSIVQLSNQRTATIYTEQWGGSTWGWGRGGNF